MTGRARGLLDDAAYLGLAALFYAAPRVLYDIHIDEDDATTFPPGTLIVTNHKRDLDSVLLPATLFWLQRDPRRPIEFAGREDMFLRGFLAGYDVVPLWLRRLLYEIDLTRVMAALRVHPVRRFQERTMDEALREVLLVVGDRPIAEVLTDRWAERFEGDAGGDAARLRLSQVLAWGWRGAWRGPASLRAFQPEVRTILEGRQRLVVQQQMHELAGVLLDGGVLYLAPEGVISADGRLQSFRGGLRLVLELVPRARIRPACIVYDFMTPGRLRVFITVGPLEPAPPPYPAALEATRRQLAALHTMTASQICSQVVWDRAGRGEGAIETASLVRDAGDLARALAGEGLRVDPAMLRDAGARVGAWLAYVERRQFVSVRGSVVEIASGAITSQPATHWANPIRYCVNELQSVRAVLRGRDAAVSSG